ncbi:hypothetical protein FGIG_00178 [Fasciola gigantica]|uniref:Doublecortin domain-containing protein n=1 Tax=Fasciola gigantica TaxID=46835 RepID=A0A504YG88_FASGI|nr:hypothetical protein FGIG_00178 [Fasciola gigantica]
MPTDFIENKTETLLTRLFTLEGKLVRRPEQIKDKQTYVATGSESLSLCLYGQNLRRIDKTHAQPGPRSTNRQSKPRHKKFLVRMDNKRGEQHKPSVKNSTCPSSVDAAAARIRAGYRGYHFRKTHPELTHTVHIARQHQDAPNINNNPRAAEPHELTPITAATRIQAGYRGYQTRKQMHQQDEPKATQSTPHGYNQSHTLPPEVAAAKIQAGFRGFRTRRELREHHEQPETVLQSNLSNLNEIRSDPNYAATRIQATFRGYQTRRALQEHNSNPSNIKYPLRSRNCNSCSTTQSHTRCHHDERDPEEVNKAATIIQAGFRGYQTRKHLHLPHTSTHESHPTGGPVNKENAEQAATRIQAAYRGFSTRKNLHETGPTAGGNMDTSRSLTTPTTRYSDPSEAATKIQATFRGYRTRRQVHVPHGNADQKLTRRDPTRTAR